VEKLTKISHPSTCAMDYNAMLEGDKHQECLNAAHTTRCSQSGE
jgi:hypothetical protein